MKPLVFVVAGVGVGLISAALMPKRAISDPTASLTLTESLNYQKLTRLNEVPRDGDDGLMVLCIGPDLRHGPHAQAGIRTYANDVALSHDLNGEFPVGSVFIKEKFSKLDISELGPSKSFPKKYGPPDFITTMKKVRPGSGADKWHYSLVDLKARIVVKEYFQAYSGGILRSTGGPNSSKATLGSCAHCHQDYAATYSISPAGMRLLRDYKLSANSK